MTENEITFQRQFTDKIRVLIKKDLIAVGKDYLVFEMTDEQTMQLGKLAMDMANSTEIKELSLKLES